ncbi:MAG: filamentous hemagglutinin N-terminal domain-containing protein [Oligoflexia bacterium]|nr:filamentous hemagglutinin N-terminal domain-containing protein [Oligoflexia bacterium]
MSKSSFIFTFTFIFTFIIFSWPKCWGLPSEGQIVSGNVAITQNENTLQINQNSPQGIIDWHSFNINSNEHVNFIQPSIDSVTLNRVTGGRGASEINGKLTSNGTIMLLNPEGILFNKSARVNVGRLLATTSNISNEDFLKRNFKFNPFANNTSTNNSGSNISIINLGIIETSKGGKVILSAPRVENHNLIEAQEGEIHLFTNTNYMLDYDGLGLLYLNVSFASAAAEAAVGDSASQNQIINSGKLHADGGKISLRLADVNSNINSNSITPETIARRVINMNGIIEADTVLHKNGEVFLTSGNAGEIKISAEGTINARGDDSGEKGGNIKLLGNRMGLFDHTKLDASGSSGGGNIRLGGEFYFNHERGVYRGQGEGPLNTNKFSDKIFVSKDSLLLARATDFGKGGKIGLWSESLTKMYGTLMASGGDRGGAGGFAEVSSMGHLDLRGKSDLRSYNGDKVGEFVIDPRNIIIQTAGSTTVIDIGHLNTYDADVDDAVLTVATLEVALGGASVIVETNDTHGGIAPQVGNITVNNPIDLPNSNSLTLRSYNNIIINSAITDLLNNGVLILEYGTGNAAGTLTTNAGATIAVDTLTITSAGGAATFNDTLTLGTLNATAGVYNVSILGSNKNHSINNVTFSNTGTLELGDADGTTTFTFGNGLTATSPSSITLSGSITATAGTITLDAVTLSNTTTLNTTAQAITFNETISGNGQNLNLNSTTGNLIFTGLVGTNPAPLTTIDIASSGDITFTGGVYTGTLDLTHYSNNAGGTFSCAGVACNFSTALTLPAAANNYNISITGTTSSITSGAAFDFTNTGTLTLGAATNLTFSNGLTATSPSSITLSGTITATAGTITLDAVTLSNTTTLNTTAQAITFNETISGNGQNLNLNSTTGNLIFTGLVGTNPAPLTTIDIASSGDITFTGGVYTGTLDLTHYSNNAGGTFSCAGVACNFSTALTLPAAANNYNISITGTTSSITSGAAFDFTNTGTLTLGAATNLTFSNGLTATSPSSITLSGSITATAGTITLDAVTLSNTTTLNTTAQAITFNETISGNGQNLNLNSTTGNLIFTGLVGSNPAPLGTIDIASSGDITFSSNLYAQTLDLSDYTADGTKTINFNNNINISNALFTSLIGYGYNISFLGSTNTIEGNTTLSNTGSLTIGDSANDSNTFVSGLTANTQSSINLVGTLESTDTASPISLAATTLTDTTNINTNSSNIIFNSTLNGAQTLNLSNSIGDITFGNKVGATIPIAIIDISSAGNITFSDALIVETLDLSDYSADGEKTISLSGNTNISSELIIPSNGYAYNFSLTGTNNTIANAITITFNNTGILMLGKSDGTSTTTFANGLIAITPSSINLAGTINASAGVITLGKINLNNTTYINTNNAGINFNNTINGNHRLSLNPGNTGDIIFAGQTGSLISPLSYLEITQAQNVTNNSKIYVQNFTQKNGSGTTSLGNSTLIAEENVYIKTNILTGSIISNRLTLSINSSCNIFATIGGLSDIEAFKYTQIENSISSGKFFLNNFDLTIKNFSIEEMALSNIFTTIANTSAKFLTDEIAFAYAKNVTCQNLSWACTYFTKDDI